MDDNNLEKDMLLDKIANSMETKVVSWNTINETIKNEICFAKIVDTSKYMSKKDSKKIEQKNYVG